VVISHLFFEQQRFDELYQMQQGQVIHTMATAA
jgi:hypothetical protein